jgi:hypothetical protein
MINISTPNKVVAYLYDQPKSLLEAVNADFDNQFLCHDEYINLQHTKAMLDESVVLPKKDTIEAILQYSKNYKAKL